MTEVWCRDRAPTSVPAAPREIGVLVVGEESGVEVPHVLQVGASEQHATAAPPRHFFRDERTVVGFAVPALHTLEPVGQRRADIVDSPVSVALDTHGRPHASVADRCGRDRCAAAPDRRRPLGGKRERELRGVVVDRHVELAGRRDLPFEDERETEMRALDDAGAGQHLGADIQTSGTNIDQPSARAGVGDAHVDGHEVGREQEFGADGADSSVGGERSHQRPQPPGLNRGVVVDERNGVEPLVLTHRPIAPFREPEIRTVLDDAYLGEDASKDGE